MPAAVVEFPDDEEPVPQTPPSVFAAYDHFTSLSDDMKNKSGNGLSEYLLKQLTKENYFRPTKVQALGIPACMSGKDTMIRCPTGMGKTLAFLIPSIQYLVNLGDQLNRSDGTRVLLVAPTRELVMQSMECAVRLTIPFPRIVIGWITGGEKRDSEKARLRKGVVFLGGTLGRIIDHLEQTASFVISKLQIMILDEVDRLLDNTSEAAVKHMVNSVKAQRDAQLAADQLRLSKQSVESLSPMRAIMVSATLTAGVQRLADFILREDCTEWIDIEHEGIVSEPIDDSLTIPIQLNQFWMAYTLKTRLVLLTALLLKILPKDKKILVFVSNCESADFHCGWMEQVKWPNVGILSEKKQNSDQPIAKQFTDNLSDVSWSDSSDDEISRPTNTALSLITGSLIFPNIPVFRLHGRMPQIDRLGNLNDFNEQESAVMFATDCGARGLNFRNVMWVIQLDPPATIADYVHRIGRTARLSNPGNSMILLLDHEIESFKNLLVSKGITNFKSKSEIEYFQSIVQDYLPEDLRGKYRLRRSGRDMLSGMVSLLRAFFSRTVEADIQMLHSARRAYTATLKAHRFLPKIYHAEKLHMGHLAAAVGLNESPRRITEKCKIGAKVAAARNVIAQNRNREKARKEASKSRKLRKMAHQSPIKFARIAEGLLSNKKSNLRQLEESMDVHEAQEILKNRKKRRVIQF